MPEFQPYSDPELLLAPERRHSTRLKCEAGHGAMIIPGVCGSLTPGLIFDATASGLGILTAASFLAGLQVTIQINCPHAALFPLLSGTIQHATRQRNGFWIVGCKLSRDLTDDELQCLLQNQAASEESEDKDIGE